MYNMPGMFKAVARQAQGIKRGRGSDAAGCPWTRRRADQLLPPQHRSP